MKFCFRALGLTAVVLMTTRCSPGPLSSPKSGKAPVSSPIPITNTGSGSGTLETERRQLLGTWELVALEYSPDGTASRVPIDASGTLIYDEFGNFTIDAHTKDPNAPVAAREKNMLAFKGRAVIDVVRHELQFMNMTGNVDPNEVLAPERRRRYELGDNASTLTLSSFNEHGDVTMVSKWHRRS